MISLFARIYFFCHNRHCCHSFFCKNQEIVSLIARPASIDFMTTMTTLSTAAPISLLMSLMSSMSFLVVRPRCFSLRHSGGLGAAAPEPAAFGRPPACFSEASGLPEAILAFTKYPPCEAPERTAVFTRFSEQFFGNGFLYCAEGFRKLLCKKHSGKKNAVAFQKKAPLQFYTLYGIIYLI